MKTLILILVLAVSAQPLQAGSCDMETNQEAALHLKQMENAGDDMPDCCDSERANSQQDCDQQMYCSFCSAGVSTKSDLQSVAVIWITLYTQDITSGKIRPSNSHPPFRPPIS